MGGIKRKEGPSKSSGGEKRQKQTSSELVEHRTKDVPAAKRSHLEAAAEDSSDEDGQDEDKENGVTTGISTAKQTSAVHHQRNTKAPHALEVDQSKQFKAEGTTSAEAHAKQRQLVKDRKAAKPHADAIQRSKQLWERLRRKSHVPKEERKQLLAELFTIIDGRVRDFVFKHDSVRVVQCAIKYARSEQLKVIVKELQYDVRALVESRYGKFLVAKMVVQGDREDKDMIVPQFYGHVKRLINHPEASWIMDDIYRQVATPQQKAMMLREWYGTEFALFGKQRPNASTADGQSVTAELSKILEESPEKKKPILSYLKTMINNLVQKKMTGFSMLHDAMLQYFLALEAGTEEHGEFLEMLKGDIDAEEEGGGGDVFRNLAFTQSGAHLVCLVLAYGSAKDRKVTLRCFKDNIELMALDPYAHMVLVVGLDVTDDTKMTSQAILRELLGLTMEDTTQRFDRLEMLLTNLNSRTPILYPMAGVQKWLLKDHERTLIEDVHAIRLGTSKKAPETRRQEVISHMSSPLLDFVANRAGNLVQSPFACQAVTEILLECHDPKAEQRSAAKAAIADVAAGNPLEEHMANDPAASRMLKTLVSGGNYCAETKSVKLADPKLQFGETLYPIIKPRLVDWACSNSSFVIVAMLESGDVPVTIKNEVIAALGHGRRAVKQAVDGETGTSSGAVVSDIDEKIVKKRKATKVDDARKGNAGARILLGKI